MRKSTSDESIVKLCGYKHVHPLEDKILLIISINPIHKITKEDEVQKIYHLTTFLLEQLDEIINDLRILYKVSEKTF